MNYLLCRHLFQTLCGLFVLNRKLEGVLKKMNWTMGLCQVDLTHPILGYSLETFLLTNHAELQSDKKSCLQQ